MSGGLTREGFCKYCGHVVPDAMVVGLVERGSAPAASVLACVAHARGLACDNAGFVPAWLADDLRTLDAEAQT